ncbi:MAG: restriction endonuclease subunit S [Planctomycetes bacterium]|nr:restriction endonuclease subunit S [Planctomycetota bacterium]
MSEINGGQHYPLDLAQAPRGWIATYIGEVAVDIQPGFPSGEHNEEGVGTPHLRPMNIDRQGRLDLAQVKYVPAANGQRLTMGDVLFNNTNSPALVGKTTAILSGDGFAFSNHMTRIRMPRELVPRFVAHQLHYLWMRGYFRHRCVNHVNQASIASKTLAQTVPLVIAPLHEQGRIVAMIEELFSDLDAGVAALERVKANLKRYRASVLKAAVEGRLTAAWRERHHDVEPASKLLERILVERRKRWEADQLAKFKAASKTPPKNWQDKYEEPAAPDTTGLPDLPRGWCGTTVATVGDVLLGRQRAPQYLTGLWSRPYLRCANVKDDRLDLSDVDAMDFDPVHSAKYRLDPGDILISEGQSPELVGQSAIYRGGIDGLCFQKTLHRFRPVKVGPASEFAQIVFRSHVKSGLFRRLASITTNIAHLTLEKFESSPFPLPPAIEQARIMEEVGRRLSVADKIDQTVRAQLTRAARLRQSILKRAFEGKLVPQDPTDEPADQLLARIQAARLAASPRGPSGIRPLQAAPGRGNPAPTPSTVPEVGARSPRPGRH